jgi:hypothetical protein
MQPSPTKNSTESNPPLNFFSSEEDFRTDLNKVQALASLLTYPVLREALGIILTKVNFRRPKDEKEAAMNGVEAWGVYYAVKSLEQLATPWPSSAPREDIDETVSKSLSDLKNVLRMIDPQQFKLDYPNDPSL